jgi:hypothetical protein
MDEYFPCLVHLHHLQAVQLWGLLGTANEEITAIAVIRDHATRHWPGDPVGSQGF